MIHRDCRRTAEIFWDGNTHEVVEELSLFAVGGPSPTVCSAARDFACIMGDGLIDDTIASTRPLVLDVDHEGLDCWSKDPAHHDWNTAQPGRGLGLLSVNTRKNETGEDMYELLLDSKGLLWPDRVRLIRKAYEHLGYPYNGD